MAILLNVLLFFWFQTAPPVPRVIVGLLDKQQVVVDNPRFSGFIQTRPDDAVVIYRQKTFHGEMSLRSISRIDFGEYRGGMPFQMTITLRNGQKVEVESERHDSLMVQGRTDSGTVVINHPDPLTSPLRLETRRPNRRDDLTIAYLEFPAS